MASDREAAVLRSVRTLFSVGSVGALSDGQLLERFRGARDAQAELAFAALVERHGPMVLGVCRGVLKDPHQTEDAFQATFLVLVRKVGTIRNQDSLGSWLYGVARRVAVRSKAGDTRRRLREREREAQREASPVAPAESASEHVEMLREEVARLPDSYRAVVVLCYLEGRTYEEAARHLGVSEGTVRGRLFRARELLRTRLTRRGVTVPCGLAGATLWQEATLAMPPGLAGSTARAAMTFATGEALRAGEVSASALALTQGVLRTMFLKKLLTGAAVAAFALGAIVVGTTLKAQQDAPRRVVEEPPRPAPAAVDRDLARLIPGKMVRDVPVTKDCMVLSYLPDWSHGDVDNIGVANNGGGVRTLIDWRGVDHNAVSAGQQVYLALYSRKTTSGGSAGSILAFPIRGEWPEKTSWKTLPAYAEEPVAATKFVPGNGWKVFNITRIILARAEQEGAAHGVLLRFLSEDRSGSKRDWSGYEFVSREGTGEWEARRPRLLVARPDGDFPIGSDVPRPEPPQPYRVPDEERKR